jgi:DnaJ-class molecular chaperone
VIFPTHGQDIVGKIARSVGRLLLGRRPSGEDRLNEIPGASSKKGGDITYSLSVSREEALSGTEIKIAYSKNGKNEKVKVKIPPGTKDGTRLRLQGMGSKNGGSTPGNLYIHVNVQ